jgi:lipopolysaccharide transport system ATP-binding protein
VDEVLAVGDASFQKKCLAKMEDVGQHGRTVVFVSHNMMAVTRLCQRTILLDEGRVIADGPSHEIVGEYLRSGLGTTAVREWSDASSAPGNDVVRLRALRVRTESGEISEAMDIRKPVRVEMEFDVITPGHFLVPNFHFFNEEGICVFIAGDHDPVWERRARPAGRFITTAWIPGNYLSEGTLVVSAAISTMDPVIVHLFERDAVAFQVVDSLDGDSARGDFAGPIPGVVRPLLKWTTSHEPEDSPSFAMSANS